MVSRYITIIFAEHQRVNAPEAEDVQEVPGGGRDPRRVEGHELDAALQHRLEPEGQREGDLRGHETRKVPVDPTADDDHGQHVREVPLEHLRHHRGVRHRVGLRDVPLLRLEDARLLVVEEVPAHEEGLLGQVLAVLAEAPTPYQSLTEGTRRGVNVDGSKGRPSCMSLISRTLPKAKNVPVPDLREVDFFSRGEKYRHVVPDDSHEECDGHDGQEHPQADRGVEAELGIRHCEANGVTGRKSIRVLFFLFSMIFLSSEGEQMAKLYGTDGTCEHSSPNRI